MMRKNICAMLPASIRSISGVHTSTCSADKSVDVYACAYTATVNSVVAKHQICTFSQRMTCTMTSGRCTTRMMSVYTHGSSACISGRRYDRAVPGISRMPASASLSHATAAPPMRTVRLPQRSGAGS
jgi:hypothetical protein